MATITVTHDEVLAWMAADPASRGAAVAARHFGVKPDTIRQWTKRRRDVAGVTASRHGVTGELHVLSHPAPAPAPVVIHQPLPKPTLPASMQAIARRATRALIARIEELAPDADPKEAAAMFAALTDRFDIIGTIAPVARKQTADPGSPEWEARVLADLAALPPHLLQQAARRGSA